MTAQTQEIDHHQIALNIAADPAGTYDRMTRSEWGAGLDRWLPHHMHAGMVRYVLWACGLDRSRRRSLWATISKRAVGRMTQTGRPCSDTRCSCTTMPWWMLWQPGA